MAVLKSSKKLTALAFSGVFAAASLLSGCVIVVDGDKKITTEPSTSQIEKNNRAAIAGLNLGHSPQHVLTLLGTPDFDEQIGDYRVLYYRTQRVTKDGLTTKDECTPLVFEENALIGWGERKLTQIEVTNKE